MIPDSELADIAKGLLAKSRKEKVEWKPVAGAQGAFFLTLPQSRIDIQYRSPVAEPDHILFSVSRPDGTPVVSCEVPEGHANWELLLGLYWCVHKQVVGWDKVLEDIHRFIGK